jgi:hypothetical protein
MVEAVLVAVLGFVGFQAARGEWRVHHYHGGTVHVPRHRGGDGFAVECRRFIESQVLQHAGAHGVHFVHDDLGADSFGE